MIGGLTKAKTYQEKVDQGKDIYSKMMDRIKITQ